MENPLKIPSLPPETLNPPRSPISPFAAGRRRHLDSACYRTLVHIFSHCLDHSPAPPRSHPADPSDKDPILSLSGNDNDAPNPRPEKDSILPPSCNNNDTPNPRPEKDSILLPTGNNSDAPNPRTGKDSILLPSSDNGPPAEPESRKQQSCDASVEVSPTTGDGPDTSPVEQPAAVADSESFGDTVFDDDMLRSVEEFLIDDVPKGELHGHQSIEEFLKDDDPDGELQESEDMDLGILLDEGDTSKEPGREDLRELASENVLLEGEEGRGVQQKMHTCSVSGVVGDDDVRVNGFMGLAGDDEEVEDGEIPAEKQVLDNANFEEHRDNDRLTWSHDVSCGKDVVSCPMSDRKDEMRQNYQCLEPQMKGSCSKAAEASLERQDALRLIVEDNDDSVTENEGEGSHAKSVDVLARKKRGPLTEERKAKKKIAKKRKRAKKDREQGVKRLKLQPNVKPKVVKQCNFYMMGRCQQGDLCKFSHDAVPLTKSQPCKYFACDSCMKGDDCAFDHQLSKYPCHNYMSKGMCIRGDKCKFSHKISTTEDSTVPIIGKSHSRLPSEKRLSTKNTLEVANGPSKSAALAANDPHKSTNSNMPFSPNKHTETNSVKRPQEPRKVPKGIRFLSFGKGPSDSSNKQEKLTMEKDGSISNREDQDKLKDRHTTAMLSAQSSNKQEKLTMQKDGSASNREDQDKFKDRHTTAMLSAQSAPLAAQPERKMIPDGAVRHSAKTVIGNTNLKNNRFCSGSVVSPFSKGLQSGVSDASKILDEFLFGAGS